MWHNNIREGINSCITQLEEDGVEIKPEKWQGVNAPAPMIEATHVSFGASIPLTAGTLADNCNPNLPWAEDHFQERVAGEPLNPGNEYKNWPYYRGNVEKHQTEGEDQFTHSYMERMWCRQAGIDPAAVDLGIKLGTPPERKGIRYRFGDLTDVLDLLDREPDTRQAFLPIWFPEDTGAVHRGRVPCSLGYWFYRNPNTHVLDCTYYIRSCDAIRHFRDDVFMAGRLCQWIIDRMLERGNDRWVDSQPGYLVMHIGSLHCWASEKPMLRRLING